MDSANSSSLQSSSAGGDDEFDSSAFFHSSTSIAVLQPPPPASSSRSHHFIDPLSGLDSTSFLTKLPSSSPASITPTGFAADVGKSLVQPPAKSPITAAAAIGPRNSKKRSRASRRAPTTVLTTDSSNFRAMVQQFTGIPSPPFVGAPYVRARLNLPHSGTLFQPYSDPPPPPPPTASCLLLPLPFMQKAQTSSATTSAIATNPNLSFQSLLQPPVLSTDFETRLQTTRLAGDGLSELTFSPGLFASENMHSIYATFSEQEDGGGRARPRPLVADSYSGSQKRASSCKLNFSGSSSPEFNMERRSAETVAAARGEGMVDSWIRSSD
ncbi:hypothetical protein Cni_G04966 [Canna indica]|uniref:VQ domain-containing protein n=1 Tax=Canna indica TaxID=4628 RepID=A0AAQ3JTX7_9LILI|nr:hypothetical protein Cni_G04966 [Canna indica]